ncbi:MAG: hypothetical protein RBU29_17505, partial [bacterium]|nr:hypothetical protein [bacterium]
MTIQKTILISLSLFLLGSAAAIGQEWITTTPLPNSPYYTSQTQITEPSYEFPALGRISDQFFGESIAQWENTLVVGAPSEFSKNQEGTAYVFEFENETWQLKARLRPSDSTPGNLFGNKVAIEGETIVIGTSLNIGKVYVFAKPESGWHDMTETAQLTSRESNRRIGYSVAIHQSVILAGVGGLAQSPAIACLFFQPAEGWVNATEDAVLTASSPLPEGWYGAAVAMDDNTIIAALTATQSVFVYQKPSTGWADATEDAVLTASDIQDGEEYGYAAALWQGHVFIGAPYHNNSRGAVYVYTSPSPEWQTMTETAKWVTPNDATTYSQFGFALASGEMGLLIAANSENTTYLAQSVEAPMLRPFPAASRGLSLNDQTICIGSPQANWVGEIRLYQLDSSAAEGYRLLRSIPDTSKHNTYFGYFAALDDDILVTGYRYGAFASVYQKKDEGWQRIAQLTTSDHNRSWCSAAIQGDTIVLGCPSYTQDMMRIGCAYVFVKNGDTWQDGQEAAILTAAEPMNESDFGKTVALDGETILVGAPNTDRPPSNGHSTKGLAYLYRKPASGWHTMTETAQLQTSPGRCVLRQFGYAIAIEGNTVIIGDPDILAFETADMQGDSSYTGGIFIYDISNLTGPVLTENANLISDDFLDGDDFGGSLALTPTLLLVGCASSLDSQNSRALLYEKPQTGWQDIASVEPVLLKPLSGSTAGIGHEVAASGDCLLIGSAGKSYKMGAGYAFYIPKPESGWQPVLNEARIFSPVKYNVPGVGLLL